jgi:hypothetical protein
MSDDFEQALSGDIEEAVEAGDAPRGTDDDRNPEDTWDDRAGNAYEVIRKPRIPRTDASRKALEQTVAKFKAEKEARRAAGDEDEGDFGPVGDEAMYEAPAKALAQRSPSTADVPAAADAAPVRETPAQAQPPVDADVKAARERIESRERELSERETHLVKRAESLESIADFDKYLESPSKSYRTWMETMVGRSLSDDEYRQEAADFVTMMSSDVLGVKLPDEVKSRIETALMKKSMASFKEKTAKREQMERERAENERAQRSWDEAASTLDYEFGASAPDDSEPTPTAAKFPYLAAVKNPGKIIIERIRAATKADGTRLSWEQAAKETNELIQNEWSAVIKRIERGTKKPASAPDTRKPLPSATAPKQSQPPQVASSGRPPGSSQVTRAPQSETVERKRYSPGSQWDNEEHRKQTLRAFAGVFKADE